MTKYTIAEKELNNVYHRLWDIKDSLTGLAGLLMQGAPNSPCYSNEEIYGLGVLIKKLSVDVAKCEKTLVKKTKALHR